MEIKILGNTTWGTTLALLFSKTTHTINLIHRKKEERENSESSDTITAGTYKTKKPNNIKFSDLKNLSFKDNDILIIAVPSNTLEQNLSLIKDSIPKNLNIIIASKGLSKSGKLLSEMTSSYLRIPSSQIGILSGPNLASEILKGKPAITSLSFEDIQTADKYRDILSSAHLRIYSSDDVIGSQIGGALKNIIAIGCGIIDKFDLGDNAKSAFITRGLREIVRFGNYHGGKEYTFYGLSGIGDLFATCASKYSRNWQFGYNLASGKSIEDFTNETGLTVEGINATLIVNMISNEKDISMPITNMTYKVIEEKYNPEKAIKEFMMRDLSQERN